MPMITNRDIIYFSSIEWNHSWQGAQEIATRLARAGNRVLYIENTGIRAPGLRDMNRVARRLKLWTRSWRSRGVCRMSPGLYVCSPLVLPPFGAGWQSWINRRLLLPSIKRVARDLDMRDPLLWIYLPTDTTIELVNSLRTPRSLLVYHYVDNYSMLTPHVAQLRQAEEVVRQASDLIFTTCQELATHCAPHEDKVHIFPNGVNLEAFKPEETASGNGNHNGAQGCARAASSGFPSPIIGYVGGLHRYVDIELLVEMARARPQWSWVCVGALQTEVRKLSALSNVYLLGHQPHHKLASYIRNFDVCIVPYVNSLFTQTVAPTKINEYLAVGKPVVSTALPFVAQFNEEHQILLTANNRTEDFLQAIEQALQLPKGAATVERRRGVAALSDWAARIEAMSELIEARLHAKENRRT